MTGPKPGLMKRIADVAHYRTTRAHKALRRQQAVEADEPAVEGSDTPSEIRQRARAVNALARQRAARKAKGGD